MILGVEIGGTKLRVGVCDKRGELRLLQETTVRRPEGRTGILRQIQRVIPGLVHEFRPRAIGVGFGGPVDVARGKIVTSHQIGGWDGFLLRQWFERSFKLPTFVENDTNCAAYAEAVHGAGAHQRRVFYFNVGTGIGGAMIIDGKLDGGRFGGGELGHTRLAADRDWPTLESVASGLAIEQGKATVAQAARRIGVAVANAIALLNPDRVIVGGGVASAGEVFWKPFRQTIDQFVFAPFRNNFKLVPAALGEAAVVVGAAALAKTRTRTRTITSTRT